jgi:type VI secretion system secreted protein Hcp
MTYDLFMSIEGIAGESTDFRHPEWIELLLLEHEIQPASVAEGSPDRPLGEYEVLKLLDRSSPKLYEACCSKRLIPQITIELCRAGDDRQRLLEIRLEDAVVSSVKFVANASGEDARPTEYVRFRFDRIRWTYTQQANDGSVVGSLSSEWDQGLD